MNGPVAACFLVFLALFLPCQGISTADGPHLPDHILAWKFENVNGRCRFDYYEVSDGAGFGIDRWEPLRHYLPLGSFPSNCYDGHSKMGLNIMQTAEGNYVFAACFFFADQNQRFVCQYLHKDRGFVNFVDVQCNDEKLARSEWGRYFFMAAFFTEEKVYNYVEYCVQGHCCRVNHDKSVVILSDDKENSGFDAARGFIRDENEFGSEFLSDYFVGHTFYHAEKSDAAYHPGFNMGFLKSYDFYHSADDRIQIPAQAASSFFGIKYNDEAGQCAVVVEKAGTSSKQKIDMDCLDGLIGEGYNIQWDPQNQTGYLKGCFVSIHPRKGPRLVCYLFKNGTVQSTAVVDHYFTGECKKHLSSNKPINVIVVTGQEKFVAVETASKLCKVDIAANGKTSEEFVKRPEYSFGYDPYKEKVFDRRTDGSINGHPLDAPKIAGLHSIGDHLLVRVDDSKWLVVKDGKVETKNWKYAYVIEEAAAKILL